MNWHKEFFDNTWLIWAVLVMCLVVLFCGIANAEEVKASWYSEASLIKEGTRASGEPQIMANGKVFNENALTCACRLYPLGTMLKITNIENGKSVIVKVTDRIGKRFAKSRIDLSKKAFQNIASLKKGLIKISVEEVN